jgi:hypothetical protein
MVTPAVPYDAARPADAVWPVLSAGRYDSFVLRVFTRAQDGQMVHGEVTHVLTRRRQRFTDLDSALAFIAAHMGTPVPEAESAEHD